jgi:hypothetical protein
MCFREPEEPTQSRRPPLNGDSSVPSISDVLGQQIINLGDGQLLELEICFLDLPKKLESRPAVIGNRPRRQASFAFQVVGKCGDMIRARRLHGRGKLQASQELQPANGMAGEPMRKKTACTSFSGPAVRLGVDLGTRDEFARSLRQTQDLGDDQNAPGEVL